MEEMKPRIFISSTFYDLKYIREDLANFVDSYNYEPILFEDGDIGYTPGKSLDKSCYEAMKNSDMVILIVGGEYGSAASGESKDGFNEYISVTRNEFRTAVSSGIPIFAMIDRKVMTEFKVYEANIDAIEKERQTIKFATTKNINVFRFIKEIRGIINIPIQEFDRAEEIKQFISKQWADMFKGYLNLLKGSLENQRIENSVDEMKRLIKKMDIMLDSVGKNVLTKGNSNEYENAVNQQDIVSLCDSITSSFEFLIYGDYEENYNNVEWRKQVVALFTTALKEIYQNNLLDKNFINKERKDLLEEIFETDYYTPLKFPPYEKLTTDSKYSLLADRGGMNKVIDILVEDNYFNKLFDMLPF